MVHVYSYKSAVDKVQYKCRLHSSLQQFSLVYAAKGLVFKSHPTDADSADKQGYLTDGQYLVEPE